jgi:peroxiredoxin Q/BCP
MFSALRGRIPGFVKRPLRARYVPAMLREGEGAPEWHLAGHDGRVHALSDGWSLLIFYPGDGTAACMAQLRDVQGHLPALTAVGCAVFGINPAGIESHRRFAATADLAFPLLADPNAAVARAYRAWVDLPVLGGQIERTVYLVNPLHKIRLANRGAPSIAAIVRSIQALQQATRAGM